MLAAAVAPGTSFTNYLYSGDSIGKGVYMYMFFMCVYIIGASLSEPHIDGNHMRDLFIWYDRHPRCAAHIQCTVRIQNIFRAMRTACCNVCVLHCASVQHCHVFRLYIKREKININGKRDSFST